MFFNKDNKIPNEKIIYKVKPNFFFSAKKAIFAFILLALLLGSTSPIIKFIADLQVYLISRINLPLTSYVVIAIVVVALVLIFYIIWQIISWYSTEYILSNQRIITKKGLFLTKKNYMPYSSIQDVSSSQSIFGRIFSVGSISAYSAYDNNNILLKNISNPDNIEKVIFNNLNHVRFSRENYSNLKNYNDERMDEQYISDNSLNFREDFPPYENGEYYPNDNYNRDDYYPEDNFQEEFCRKNQHEKNINKNPDYNNDLDYDDDFDNRIYRDMDNLDNNKRFYPNENKYYQNQVPRQNKNNFEYNKDIQNFSDENIKENYPNQEENEDNNNSKKLSNDENILTKHSKKFKR